MTENEALKHIQSYAVTVDGMIGYCRDFETKTDITGYLEKKAVFDMATAALKEIQQYREIGTVEECREAVEKSRSLYAYIKQVLWERNIAIQQLEEIGISLGEKMDFVKNAVEKRKPKKPIWKNGSSIICKDYSDEHGEITKEKWADWTCPNCDWFVGEQYIPRHRNQRKCNYCTKCGQAIQWEESEEE